MSGPYDPVGPDGARRGKPMIDTEINWATYARKCEARITELEAALAAIPKRKRYVTKKTNDD